MNAEVKHERPRTPKRKNEKGEEVRRRLWWLQKKRNKTGTKRRQKLESDK